MRYNDEHKQKTRAKVLGAAAKAIRAEGPDRVGVAAVMAEAGLTHGGFYAHFASKDDLVAAAIGQMFDEATARFEATTGGRSPREALEAYIGFYLSRTHRDGRDSGCPLPALAAHLPNLAPPSREAFSAGVARMTGRIAAWLESLGHARPQVTAASVMSELVGAVGLARAVSDPAQSDEILQSSRAALRARLGLDDAHD